MKLVRLVAVAALMMTSIATGAQRDVKWDRLSLIIDGHRVVPVMGEVHYRNGDRR